MIFFELLVLTGLANYLIRSTVRATLNQALSQSIGVVHFVDDYLLSKRTRIIITLLPNLVAASIVNETRDARA